ncbi:hypothetical protein AGMMS50256_03260 [Betaproteobacteria bacterium]|nr:hypothetical protein AGMMS50256_03260 [Betaproteobacteria bacterium]
MPPLPGDKAGFFKEFPPGCILDKFSGINLSSRKFKHDAAKGISELAFENEFAVIQYRDHHDSSLMLYVFARGLAGIRQANPIQANVEEPALKNLRTFDRRLGKVRKAFRMGRLHFRK